MNGIHRADPLKPITKIEKKRHKQLDAAAILNKAQETDAIANRHGYMWQCIGRKKNGKGYIYRFQFKQEFNVKLNSQADQAISNAYAAHFPAVEATNHKYAEMERRQQKECDYVTEIYHDAIYHKLGYHYEEVNRECFLEVPDANVLKARWDALADSAEGRKRGLKKIKILSSKGIASDEVFVEGFKNFDILISTGSEFIHDQSAHVIPTLEYMYNNPEGYSEARALMVQDINQIYEKIKGADQWVPPQNEEGKAYYARLQKNLAYASIIPAIAADIYATNENHEDWLVNRDIIRSDAFTNELKTKYSNYLQRRELAQEISIPWVWDEIRKIHAPPSLLDKIGRVFDYFLGFL